MWRRKPVMKIRVALIVIALCIAGLLARTDWLRAEAERLHPPNGQFVSVSGGRLHYREQVPAGTPRGTVVLIHGASSNHADLLATLGPELSQYRVIALDRPGHGWSDRLDGRRMADPARQAAAVMEALDHIAPERFVLVAHSLGGALSTRIALDRPERLRGLVLLGALTHPWATGIPWYFYAASWPVVGPLFTHLIGVPASDMLLSLGAKSVFVPQPMTPGFVETGEIRLLQRPQTFQANAQDLTAAHGFVTTQALRYRDIQVPVVAITGDSDTIVSPAIHSSAIARQAPQGRLVLLPDVGHMPHHAAPEIVADAIDHLAGPRSDLALLR